MSRKVFNEKTEKPCGRGCTCCDSKKPTAEDLGAQKRREEEARIFRMKVQADIDLGPP